MKISMGSSPTSFRHAFVAAVAVALFASTASAANVDNFVPTATGAYSWNDPTNWSSNPSLPGPTDVAVFTGAAGNTLTVTLDGNQTVYAVSGLASGAAMNIGAGTPTTSTLTLLSTDTTNTASTFTAINAPTGTSFYNVPIVLGNASTSGGTITIASAVNSTNLEINGGISNFAGQTWGVNITGAGAGLVNFTGTPSTYNGDTTISSNSLRLLGDNLLPNGAGKGNVNILSGATLNNSNNNLIINGLNGAGTYMKSGSNTRTTTLGAGDANGSFSGAFSTSGGSSALTKTGLGTQTFTGSVSIAGAINANAGLLLFNTSVTAATANTAATGTLGGTGTLTLSGATNTLVNNGTIAPGSAGVGALTISAASATLNANSTLAIEIGGNSAGSGYDQLNLTNAGGALTLNAAANLAAALVNGYTPTASDVDYILTRADAGSFANGFNGLSEGSTVNLGAYTAQITYLANWTGSQATSTVTGGNDVALFNFQPVPVPEPASLGVLVLGGASLLVRRRRR
jgi:hypothetical protein